MLMTLKMNKRLPAVSSHPWRHQLTPNWRLVSGCGDLMCVSHTEGSASSLVIFLKLCMHIFHFLNSFFDIFIISLSFHSQETCMQVLSVGKHRK